MTVGRKLVVEFIGTFFLVFTVCHYALAIGFPAEKLEGGIEAAPTH